MGMLVDMMMIDLLLWVVDNLSFDWNIVVSFYLSFSSNIFDCFFWNVLWNVLSEILYCIVVDFSHLSGNLFNNSFFSILSNFSGSWNSIYMLLISILDDFLLERNILNSAFTLDDFFAHINSCINNLRLAMMMNIYMMSWNSSCNIIMMMSWNSSCNMIIMMSWDIASVVSVDWIFGVDRIIVADWIIVVDWIIGGSNHRLSSY